MNKIFFNNATKNKIIYLNCILSKRHFNNKKTKIILYVRDKRYNISTT